MLFCLLLYFEEAWISLFSESEIGVFFLHNKYFLNLIIIFECWYIFCNQLINNSLVLIFLCLYAAILVHVCILLMTLYNRTNRIGIADSTSLTAQVLMSLVFFICDFDSLKKVVITLIIYFNHNFQISLKNLAFMAISSTFTIGIHNAFFLFVCLELQSIIFALAFLSSHFRFRLHFVWSKR